ncbi:MAG: Hydroxypyruvate reductase [Alphaproteobacteria bacterium MarineAlpha2_Bin1]|nr:MAG: Hydroxypyruvate reductase [Alphaproteobacteria bacterium MarineAlpha2_Bin1]
MTFHRKKVLISFKISKDANDEINKVLGDIADIYLLDNIESKDRFKVIKESHAIIVTRPNKEFNDEEISLFSGKFIQSFISGIDSFQLNKFPKDVLISHNGGAFAEPIAEYIVGIILNSFRELNSRYLKLKNGEWDQFSPTKSIYGMTCGIIGYGGIGKKTAQYLRVFGMNIMAINRSGYTKDKVNFIGKLSELDKVLSLSDIVILSIGLNQSTRMLINENNINVLKKNSLIINVARGSIINQKALYNWLKANSEARACIDSWWREPITHGDFNTEYPFLDLPNFFGSPHNSAITKGAFKKAGYQAAENVKSFLENSNPERLVTLNDQ